MAGSYDHVVTDDGNLGSNQFVIDMLENGGDVYETIEQMYGMIWYLATVLSPISSPLTAQAAVEEAQAQYQVGLVLAKKINGSQE